MLILNFSFQSNTMWRSLVEDGIKRVCIIDDTKLLNNNLITASNETVDSLISNTLNKV